MRDERSRGVRELLERPAAKRVARADVQDDDGRTVRDAGCRERRIHALARAPGLGHAYRIAGAIRRRHSQRLEEIPLVLDRMPRSERPRPIDGLRVHPAPAGDGIADALGRAGQPRQPRPAWTAVKIDDDVERAPPQLTRDRDVVDHAAECRR